MSTLTQNNPAERHNIDQTTANEKSICTRWSIELQPQPTMTESPTSMPIVLLFIRILFYIFAMIIVNNEYKFVKFGDLNNHRRK